MVEPPKLCCVLPKLFVVLFPRSGTVAQIKRCFAPRIRPVVPCWWQVGQEGESWGAPALAGPALGGSAQLSLLSFFAHSVLPQLTMILLWHCGEPVVDLWWPQLALIVLQIQAPPLLNLLSTHQSSWGIVSWLQVWLLGFWLQVSETSTEAQKSTFMEKFEPPLKSSNQCIYYGNTYF